MIFAFLRATMPVLYHRLPFLFHLVRYLGASMARGSLGAWHYRRVRGSILAVSSDGSKAALTERVLLYVADGTLELPSVLRTLREIEETEISASIVTRCHDHRCAN